MMMWGLRWLALLAWVYTAQATTNMDPKVSITETVPPDNGRFVVRGFLAQDVTLTCFVENLDDKSTQVKWARTMLDKSGRPTDQLISTDMDVQDNNKWSIEKPTTYSWRLRIKALQVEDEGNYTCYVQLNMDARSEANRTVLATDPPTIIEGLMSSDLTIKENDRDELTCNASGRPLPTLMWRREGNAILPDGGVLKLGGKLVISSAKFTDRGKYHCRAVNEVGEITREIFVNVQFSPKLTSEGDVSQAVNYQRTLICYVDANPSPNPATNEGQLYWTKDKRNVQFDDRIRYNILEGAYNRLIYELIITSVREEDYGEYVCNARTTIGEPSSLPIRLIKSDTPVVDKGGATSGAPSTHCAGSLLISLILTSLLKSQQS